MPYSKYVLEQVDGCIKQTHTSCVLMFVFIFHNKICRANWIKVTTMQLKQGDVVILSLSDDQKPTFGTVEMILVDDQDVLLCTKVCTNAIYESHLHAWEIKPSSEVLVVKFNTEMTQQILHPIPAKFDTYYVSLKHAL